MDTWTEGEFEQFQKSILARLKRLDESLEMFDNRLVLCEQEADRVLKQFIKFETNVLDKHLGSKEPK